MTHLKMVAADKHAIKDFDRELSCILEDYSYAAGIEAVIPAKCAFHQMLLNYLLDYCAVICICAATLAACQCLSMVQ